MFRQRVVKHRVEAGDVGYLWKSPTHIPHHPKSWRKMHRSKLNRFFKLTNHFGRYALVPLQAGATVHNSMSDNVRRWK